jgi:ribonuclease P protein component
MRIGLIVPRFKQSAVARNRLKRRLRELSRQQLLPTGLSADVVVRIRPDAYSATFDALAADIQQALVQLTRWKAAANSAPVIS